MNLFSSMYSKWHYCSKSDEIPNTFELKTKLENLSKVEEVTTEVTELAEVKPISFNPENKNEVENFQFGSKRARSTMDAVMEKISNLK